MSIDQSIALLRRGLTCAYARPDDASVVFELERDGYPWDEAASLSKIEMRIWVCGTVLYACACVYAFMSACVYALKALKIELK
jgi:hypothetical protein